MKRVIVTGDDFGLALPVNEAIEAAHRRGILTTASLMVAGAAAADAVERARSLPSLRVGLHIVLVEGRPMLPRAEVPDLADARGAFSENLARAGFSFYFRPAVRRQLEAEIRAQYRAFERTGLALDHVNAHNHMHLHPTVLRLILDVGREFGLRAVRVPREPALRSWRAARRALVPRLLWRLFLAPSMGWMRSRIRRAKLASNDFVFGMSDSGVMGTALVLRMLEVLPDGVTEIYFHPATRRCPEIDSTMPGYQHEAELETLTSAAVARALADARIARIAFSDL